MKMKDILLEKNKKRVTAAILAALLVLETPGVGPMASPVNIDEASAQAQDIAYQVSENDIATDQEMTNNTDENVEETVLEEEIFEDDSLQAYVDDTIRASLTYVYLEKDQLTTSESEKIVVAASIEQQEICKPELVLQRVGDGNLITLPMYASVEEAFAFEMKAGEYGEGYYQLVKLQGQTEAGDAVVCDIAGVDGLEDAGFVVSDTQIAAERSAAMDSGIVSIAGSEGVTGAASDAITNAIRNAGGKVTGDATISAETATASNVVVFLDAGHDDTHAGARGNGLAEEALTLKVANYCKEYLESTYTNVTVFMSRYGGACPHPGTKSGDDNALRVTDAASQGADVYVSIHFNTTGTSSTISHGAMVFYPNGNYNASVGAEGSVVASKVLEQLAALGLNNNGIKTRNSESGDTYADGSLADYYAVIRKSKQAGFPGIIIEHAFLNNAGDAGFLYSEENVKSLGIADAIGIANAYNLSTEPLTYAADELLISDIDGANGSFRMVLTGAKPQGRIKEVKYVVTPTEDSTASYTYTATYDEEEDEYVAIGAVANHDSIYGSYKVTAYAYDLAGKKYKMGTEKFKIEEAKLDTSKMKLTAQPNSSEKTVTIVLKGNTGAKEVSFKVQSEKTQKKKTYKAELSAKGNWVVKMPTSDFRATGEYSVVAYSTSYADKKVKVKEGSFSITPATVSSIKVKKLDLGKGTFKAYVYNPQAPSGLKSVKLRIALPDGEDDEFDDEESEEDEEEEISEKTYLFEKTYALKKSGSNYYADVNLKDFDYTYGDYELTAVVEAKNGTVTDAKTKVLSIEEPDPELTAKVTNAGTKLTLIASDLGISVDVSGFQFNIKGVDTENSVTKKIDGQKQKDGSYKKVIPLADLGQAGTYKVTYYKKNAKGKNIKLGTSNFEIKGPQGGQFQVKKVELKKGTFQLRLKDVESKAKLDKVTFTIKNKVGKNIKKNYTAKKSGSYYYVKVSMKDFGDALGKYVFQATVTDKNKISYKTKWASYVFVDDDPVVETKVKEDKKSFTITASNLNKTTVKGIRFHVFATADPDTVIKVVAKKKLDGSYQATVNVDDYEESDKFKFTTYAKDADGNYEKIVEATEVVVKKTIPDLTGYYSITGENNVTVDQMVAYYKSKASYPSFYAGSDAKTIKKFCQIYYDECAAENIRVEVAFTQAMKETNFLRYGGDVQISQYNFAGLGATGGGVQGNSFSSVRIGVRAQVQHLKAYANDEPLVQDCVDIRFPYVKRGTSPYVEWLGIPDNPYGGGWAADMNYGSSIKNMIAEVMSF